MCLENYPGNRFYGTVTPSLRDQAAACPLLTPFLKNLTVVLAGARGQGPGLEPRGPGTCKAAHWSHAPFCCQSQSCLDKF